MVEFEEKMTFFSSKQKQINIVGGGAQKWNMKA